MAQYYTLEEAAQKLGLTTEEFRRKLATEWKTTPRRYPDGATLRFQTREVDELARTLGGASDAELQLGDAPLRLADDSGISSDDFVALGADKPAGQGDSSSSSSGKLKKSASDSDVRLDVSGATVRPAGRAGIDSTDNVDLDAEQRAKPPSSKKNKPTPQVSGDAGKKADAGSDFDLSLTSDSSDEFELQLTDSDEVDIGVTPGGKGLKSGDSGINLQSPADSGISLEKSSDFELALEGGPKSGPKTAPKSGPKTAPKPKSGPKTGPPLPPAADESEFELTLDDNAGLGGDATSAFPEGEQKDIFETDFELPALDDESGSEAVALEESDTDLESSDFDLAIDEGDAASEEESGSQVVALEEDEAAPRRRRLAGDEDLDELEAADEYEEDEAERPVRAAAEPAEWGLIPALVLIPCVLVMMIVGLMSWELVHGMWGYQQPGKATGPIVRFFAESFGDGKLPAE